MKLKFIREADKLIKTLQDRIDKNPSKFKENYGQREISNFETKLSELHYVDKCDVMAKFDCVGWMRPNIKTLK